MKRAILLLILANLVLYLWRSNSQPPEDEAPPPPPTDAEQLVLLAERGQIQETQTEPAAEETETASSESTPVSAEEKAQTPDTKPEPVCYTLGPLANEDDAEQLAARLAEAKVRSSTRTSTVDPGGGLKYLVYIPAMQREDANKIAEELTARGVRDFYIAERNFIALGVFSDKDHAMERTEELYQLGYTTAVKEEGDTRTEYWLDALQEDPAAPTVDGWKSMLSPYPQAALQSRDCKEIALSEAEP